MTEKVRRPRHEFDPVVLRLAAWANNEVGPDNWEFGGSWRRMSPLVGDIDLVVFRPTFAHVELPEGFIAERHGDVVIQGDYLGAHVDLWACDPAVRGPFMWFITGPKDLNVWMRSRALSLGTKLSQYGLGDLTEVPHELMVSGQLGLPWLPPEQRDRWKDAYLGAPATADRTGPRYRSVEFEGDTGKYKLTEMENGKWRCSCPAFTYRKTCKHSRQPARWINGG